MAPHVADEVNAHAARSLVVDVAVQAERLQVAREFAGEQRGGLSAAGVAGFLGAEEDEGEVWAGAGFYG